MTEIEPTQAHIERAIEVLNEDAPFSTWTTDDLAVQTLARALAAHDADRRAFSEVAKGVVDGWKYAPSFIPREVTALRSFILPEPEPVDPLVLVRKWFEPRLDLTPDEFEAFLAKHNLEIREINNG